MPESAPARSITKSVAIDRPAAQVHDALVDTELATLKRVLESR
jgi:hypothetical protein